MTIMTMTVALVVAVVCF